jgi:ribosomal protein S18 acetylase RimI-like enzyme
LEFVIRQYEDGGDFDAVMDLWRRSGPGVQLARSDARDELRKKAEFAPELFLVAELQGAIVGTVIGGYDGRRGMVYHLAVAQGLRRQGIGSALMAELEARLRKKGCLKSYLLVTRNNPDGLEFYRRHGWDEMDIHLMGKELL